MPNIASYHHAKNKKLARRVFEEKSKNPNILNLTPHSDFFQLRNHTHMSPSIALTIMQKFRNFFYELFLRKCPDSLIFDTESPSIPELRSFKVSGSVTF